jgi:hypothetical protein
MLLKPCWQARRSFASSSRSVSRLWRLCDRSRRRCRETGRRAAGDSRAERRGRYRQSLLVPLAARVCEAFPTPSRPATSVAPPATRCAPSCSWTRRDRPGRAQGAFAGARRQPGRGTVEQIVA